MSSSLSFLSGNHALVKKLLGLVKKPEFQSNSAESDDKAWREKAIKSIIKKIKNTPGALDNLERAISNRDSNTDCVTLTRLVYSYQYQSKIQSVSNSSV